MPIAISRALEVMSEDGRESGEGTWEEYLAAIQLGREALERCQHNYLNPQHADFRRLPSEIA